MEQTIFDVTIYVPYTADLHISFGAQHSYSSLSGSIPWDIYIKLDGNIANHAGGAGAYTDAPSCFAAIGGLSAGYHNIQVTWIASTYLSMHGCTCAAEIKMK